MTTLLTMDAVAPNPPEQTCPNFSRYVLKWRQRQLLVEPGRPPQNSLVLPEDRDWLVACLQRSPVELVRLSPDLSESEITFWADVCEQAGQPVYLRVPNKPGLPNRQARLSWWLKRMSDLVLALLALLVLGPVLLVLSAAIVWQSPGPIFFRQWRVGERGKLFRILKFRTMIVGAERLHHQVMGNQEGLHKHKDDPRVTPLGRWMRKYSVDELPQLLNVLRGEMSLVGPRPWALYDALRIHPNIRQRLNALPGMTGSWQVFARSHLLDLQAVNQHDLDYLQSWSLGQDFKILLLTVPKVLTGFGAF